MTEPLQVETAEPVWTVKEAAGLIGISERSLWEVIRRREIDVLRYGSARGRGARNMTRIEQAAINEYKARHPAGRRHVVRTYKRVIKSPRGRMLRAARMRGEGMSLRQIGAATGTSYETARRDLAKWDAEQAQVSHLPVTEMTPGVTNVTPDVTAPPP